MRCLQWPLSWLFLLPVAAGLEACPAIPSFCQRGCLPQPQIKNAKGAARKSGSPRLSGLMSKMFQSSGNLLQSGILSLLLQRASERKRNEREEKWYLVVGSDRSTFLSIDMRSEWGVLLLLQQSLNLTDKKHRVHGQSSKIELSQTNWLNSKRICSRSYTNRQHARQWNVLFIVTRVRKSCSWTVYHVIPDNGKNVIQDSYSYSCTYIEIITSCCMNMRVTLNVNHFLWVVIQTEAAILNLEVG